MSKAEALLKVIGSRPDNLADNFATLMPSASAAVYQKILDLKVLHPFVEIGIGIHMQVVLHCRFVSAPTWHLQPRLGVSPDAGMGTRRC